MWSDVRGSMQSTPPNPSGQEHWPLYELHSAYWPQVKAGSRQLKLQHDQRSAADKVLGKGGRRSAPGRTVLGPVAHESQLGAHSFNIGVGRGLVVVSRDNA